MPDAVAKRVLSKYTGQYWVSNPYMDKELICGNKQVLIKFSEVHRVSYNRLLNKVFLHWGKGVTFLSGCDWARRSFDVQNESEATEVANALISLGAPIRGIEVLY
jgi:hypothetical protein